MKLLSQYNSKLHPYRSITLTVALILDLIACSSEIRFNIIVKFYQPNKWTFPIRLFLKFTLPS
jgi:hypothetical protein